MPITPSNPFKGRQYPGELILLCVRWYLRYPLAYEHVAEIIAERGIAVDASCIWRWVQAYAPELNKRCRQHLKSTNKSYRVDETYIKVKGEDKYLYRAVDSTGQTIEFLLTAKRDAAAAKRFFRKALSAAGNAQPRVINVDKNPGYPAAVEALKAEGTLRRRCRLRQCKYLNNVVTAASGSDHVVLTRSAGGRLSQPFCTPMDDGNRRALARSRRLRTSLVAFALMRRPKFKRSLGRLAVGVDFWH
ncbi:MAG TPA: IS6 family transposase [Bryobacteraceae bacterium]|nr:IS6 family transposase [Bryobacteraceae bacterium]